MPELAVTEMTLYKHGVGFFVREGRIEGTQTTLSFKTDEVNDILKSLTIYDRLGGSITGINYQAPLTITEKLDSNLFHLHPDKSISKLLINMRGRHMRLQTSDVSVEGQVIGMEISPAGDISEGKADHGRVSVLDEQGSIHVLPLVEITQMRLLDEQAENDLSFFLETIATTENRKDLRIDLSEGMHNLVAYYVAPSPTWRVSYRFIGENDPEDPSKGRAHLQAWALFDNRLEEDLDNVQLTFIAGQPISFIYELFESMIPERPIIENAERVAPKPADALLVSHMELETLPAPSPKRRSGGGSGLLRRLESGDDEMLYSIGFGEAGPSRQQMTISIEQLVQRALEKIAQAGIDEDDRETLRTVTGEVFDALLAEENIVLSRSERRHVHERILELVLNIGLVDYAPPVDVEAGEQGALFKYAVSNPVTVKRGESAMVPIIFTELDYHNELIYSDKNELSHPVAAVRFTNESGLTFEHGPVTIIEDGNYLGEAVVPFSRSNTKLYLPYAVELNIHVRLTRKISKVHHSIHFSNQNIVYQEYEVRTTTYIFDNRLSDAKVITLQVPVDLMWSLHDTPKPKFMSAHEYSWSVDTPATAVTQFTIIERRMTERQEASKNLTYQRLAQYLRDKWLDQETVNQLEDILQQRDLIAQAHADINALKAERDEINQRQEQLRNNISTLQNGAGRERELYERMLDQFMATEDRIDEIARLIGEQEAAMEAADEAINQMILALSEQE